MQEWSTARFITNPRGTGHEFVTPIFRDPWTFEQKKNKRAKSVALTQDCNDRHSSRRFATAHIAIKVLTIAHSTRQRTQKVLPEHGHIGASKVPSERTRCVRSASSPSHSRAASAEPHLVVFRRNEGDKVIAGRDKLFSSHALPDEVNDRLFVPGIRLSPHGRGLQHPAPGKYAALDISPRPTSHLYDLSQRDLAVLWCHVGASIDKQALDNPAAVEYLEVCNDILVHICCSWSIVFDGKSTSTTLNSGLIGWALRLSSKSSTFWFF